MSSETAPPEPHRPSWSSPRRALLLGAFALALLAVGVGYWGARGSGQSPLATPPARPGAPAPDFTVRKLDGGALRLSELRGQPVWLNFWASWCVPCRAEMPDLAVVGPEAERRGVRLVAINAGERPEVARAFIEGAGLDSLPVALDPDGEATAAYRLYSFPTHVFIDSDGVIREVTVRLLNAADMRQAVARLQ